MMGIKVNQEKMFYNFSLSKHVPEDHFLRTLTNIIDLRFVRELVVGKYSHTGQRSVDPEVLFKMMLIGYFYGITSERRLAEDISLNMAYMWYIGYDLDEPTPHHSVISKARARYGKEVFETFFNRILEQCVKAGLVNGEKVFADSTIIRADASLKSLALRKDAVEPAFSSKEFVEKVFTENKVEPDAEAKNSGTPNDNKQNPAAPRQSYSNKTHVSKTDPEAAVVSHGRKLPLQLAYKEHFAVDSKARVITAVEVTPASVGDETQLVNLIEKQPGPVKEVGADTKYGTCSNYKYLIEHNILPSIPSWESGSPGKEHRFPQKQFAYDELTDTLTCPNGKKLTRNSDAVYNNAHTYHAKKKDCNSCLLRAKCVSPKTSCRHIFRQVDQTFKDRAKEYLSTSHAQETIRQRKSYAELINADSKTRHGLRRAMFRGLNKVTIQVLLTASVQNIKRLMAHSSCPGTGFKELFTGIRNFITLLLSQTVFA
jgi:transposase